jgi:hypothetical protein
VLAVAPAGSVLTCTLVVAIIYAATG